MPDAIPLKSEGPQDASGRDSGGSTESGVVVEPSRSSSPPLPRRVRTRLTLEEATDELRRLKGLPHPEDCEMVEDAGDEIQPWCEVCGDAVGVSLRGDYRELLGALKRWLTASDALDNPASGLEACEEYGLAGEALEVLARKILL